MKEDQKDQKLVNQSQDLAGVSSESPLTALDKMRIIGPTVRDTFFIATDDNLVWTERGWRQFGHPQEWSKFRGAWLQVEAARIDFVSTQVTSA